MTVQIENFYLSHYECVVRGFILAFKTQHLINMLSKWLIDMKTHIDRLKWTLISKLVDICKHNFKETASHVLL